MTQSERQNWHINIENAAAAVVKLYGKEHVDSVFQRYDARSLGDLSPYFYCDVFNALELIANDK